MPVMITHTIAFAVRLLDTTSGAELSDRARFLLDGAEVRPVRKPDGLYVFFGELGPEAELTVSVFGYETLVWRITPEAFQTGEPVLVLELIPDDFHQAYRPCHTLAGQLPGIKALEAVRLGETSCLIREFDARKRLVTVFNPHSLALDRAGYALVDPDNLTYEPFTIVKRLSDQSFKIDRILKETFSHHFPVTPRIFGRTDASGRYLLRVRDISAAGAWLVRVCTEEEVFFKRMDFRLPETARL